MLAESILRLMAADGQDEYRLEMMRLIARVNDTHANLWSHLRLRPPVGGAQLPVEIRFVEDVPVVTGYNQPEHGPKAGLQVGDVILSIDGVPVHTLVDRWRPYYAASNEPTRLRDIARSLTRGEPADVRLAVQRHDDVFETTVPRVPSCSSSTKPRRVARNTLQWHYELLRMQSWLAAPPRVPTGMCRKSPYPVASQHG